MPPPTNLVKYNVDEEQGVLTRAQGTEDPVVIADYDPKTGVLKLKPEFRNFRVAAVKHLNDKGWKFTGHSEAVLEPDAEDIPPRPKKNPRIGDKTPAYVEWMARYRKEEFLVTFACLKLQHRTGWNRWTERIRGEDGHWIDIDQQEPIYEDLENLRNYDVDMLLDGRHRMIADRTSIITLKPAKGVQDDEYDWDLVEDEMQAKANDYSRGVRA